GAVDAVVEPEILREAALDLLTRAIGGELDWQAKRAEKLEALKLNENEAMMTFETARAFIAGKAGPNYPAPLTIVGVMQASARFTLEGALEIEAEGFAELAKSKEATALIGLFLGDQLLKKKAKQSAKQARPVKRAAVLGAGIMGGGVAYQSSYRGIPIAMKDIAQAQLDLGMSEATKIMQKRVDRGRMEPKKMAQVLTGITPTLSYENLKDADLVVEAVVEKESVKKIVLAEAESLLRENAILTSNTSTISITKLAQGLKRPEQFCGMHFFNPVHRMPLVEVICGEKSSELTIAATVAYAAAMGKSPIVVNDCPGFLINRVLFPYFAGFSGLVNDGVDFVR
ncbi:MAG: 3-hydroxyacyl-CoA dehydrogenase NAD-binding domain-containing protein, partial [Candidatus Lambdaproteobacteria bacterium]